MKLLQRFQKTTPTDTQHPSPTSITATSTRMTNVPVQPTAIVSNDTPTLSPTAKRQKKQQLFRAINACKELLREPLLRAHEMQLLYRNGAEYHLLQNESALLEQVPLLLSSLSAHQQTRMENFEFSLELLQEKKDAFDKQLPPFLEKEAKLKADIQEFTKAVKETQAKHKLSPDWDGKKPMLMTLGAQLQERRDAYDKDEETLNATAEKLYALHSEFHQEFTLFCEELLPLLEKEFASLSQ